MSRYVSVGNGRRVVTVATAWRGRPGVRVVFQAATTLTLGNGESTLFRTDRWLDGSTIRDLTPTIFACVRPRKRSATVTEALHNQSWVRHFVAPLTMQVVMEFDGLYDCLESVHLSDSLDTFS